MTRGMRRRDMSTVERRVAWIKRRAKESRAWQILVECHEPFEAATKRFIVDEMRAAGLFAPRTYWSDVNLNALFDLVREVEKK